MLAAIGQMLPLAVAGALSTVPIIGVLTLLLGGRDRLPAVLFGAGYVVGVFVVTGLATVLFRSAVSPRPAAGGGPLLGVPEIVLGVASVVGGVVVLRRPRGSGSGRLRTAMTRTLGSVGPTVAALVGAGVALRPKSLLLASALGLVLAPDGLDVAPVVVVVVLDVVVGTSTATVPVVLALLRRDHAVPQLEAIRAWIARNARTVTAIVLLLIGTVLVGDALGRF